MKGNAFVLGISGMPGSGKGTFINICEKKGGKVFRMGNEVRKEVKKRKLTLTPENVGRIANEMREKHGSEIWAQRTLQSIKSWLEREGSKGEFIIIDGIRSIDEVNFFKKHFSAFILLSLHASPSLRWRRMKERRRSDDFPTEKMFLERDERELKWGIGEVIALSDEIISNNGSLEELERKAEEFFSQLKEGKVQYYNI